MNWTSKIQIMTTWSKSSISRPHLLYKQHQAPFIRALLKPKACTQPPKLSAESPRSGSRVAQEGSGDPALHEMGVGRTAKGSAQQETEDEEPQKGLGVPNTVLTRLSSSASPTPGPVVRPGPSTPRHHRVTPNIPALGNKNPEGLQGRTPT